MTLVDLFFVPKGRAHRSGFVMMQIYSIMAFFVCVVVLSRFESLFLVPDGLDYWYAVRYLLAGVGVLLSIYVYVLSFLKRIRDLDWPLYSLWLSAVTWANVVIAFFPGVPGPNRHGEEPGRLYPHSKRTRTGLWIDISLFLFIELVVVVSLVFVFELDTAMKTLIILLASGIFIGGGVYFRHRFVGLDSQPVVPKVEQHFWFEVLLILIIVFFIRSFFITPYQILGPSMDPSFFGGQSKFGNYTDGEFILVDKFSHMYFGVFDMALFHRGDVVVFTPRVHPVKKYLIKRIIGLPGDMLKIHEGRIWIKTPTMADYVALDERAYLALENVDNTCIRYSGSGRSCTITERQVSYEYRIPEGKYFLMGDNRSQSLDSRQCFQGDGGCNIYREAQFIPRSQIQGRVLVSLGHFDMFDHIIPPKLGSWQWTRTPRWTDIPISHTYSELTQ